MPARRASSRESAADPMSPAARQLDSVRNAPSGDARSMVFRTLEAGDPVLRMQLMGELLGRMDASNFREILAEAESVSNETGREHTDEWKLLNIRAGQVAGLAAMEAREGKNDRFSLNDKTFFGWASVDPAAAKQWLDEHADNGDSNREGYLNTLISGAVVHDPEEAAKMLAGLSKEDRANSLHDFTDNLVDAAGKDGAINWLKTVQAANDDPEYTAAAAQRVFDRLLWSGANRLNAASMVTDLERMSAVMPVDEGWIVRSMGQIRDRNTTGGIDLLSELAKSPVMSQVPLTERAWSSAVDYAVQMDPQGVQRWLANNPGSPIYQKVAEMSGR